MMFCPNPGLIRAGRIHSISPNLGVRTRYPEGTTLEYKCNDGYSAEGALKQTCLISGKWTPTSPPTCIRSCGRFQPSGGRTINGSLVEVDVWPWVVAISDRRNRLICGGAVLNSQMIITAAQCVTRGGPFTLRFGKHYRENGLDDANVLKRRSDEIFIHPNFRNNSFDSDIALVTFKGKIIFSPFVQPICLPTAVNTAKNLREHMGGYVIEWGLVEKQAQSQELTIDYLPFLNDSNCIQMLPDVEPFLTRNMFCAGSDILRQAVCNRDKGLPFVFFDPGLQRVTLEGLVSIGLPGQCGQPTVFTKIYRFVPWIYSHDFKRLWKSEP